VKFTPVRTRNREQRA